MARKTPTRRLQPCLGGCGRRTQRAKGRCLVCAPTVSKYALVGGHWERRGHVQVWVPTAPAQEVA